MKNALEEMVLEVYAQLRALPVSARLAMLNTDMMLTATSTNPPVAANVRERISSVKTSSGDPWATMPPFTQTT